MMTHPDDLLLTRWLDGEADDAPHLADHVALCRHCRQRLEDLAAEGRLWSDALALAPTELAELYRADLPSCLVATVTAGRMLAGRRRCLWHLLILIGASLAVSLSWVLVAPLATPLLGWAARLVNITSVIVIGGVQVIRGTLALLTQPFLLATASLASELLVVVAALLLASLWFYRLRPMPARHTT
jgi:hypothetical protein